METTFTSQNWLVHKITNEALANAFCRYATGVLADIGCGDKPYREMLKPYVTQHVGIDHADTIHDKASIDLLGTAYDIPVSEAPADHRC